MGERSPDWKWHDRCLAAFHTTLGFNLSSMDLKRAPIRAENSSVRPSSRVPISSQFFNTLLMIYVSKYILHRLRIVCPVIAYHINGGRFRFLRGNVSRFSTITGYITVYIDIFTWMNRDERTNTNGITKYSLCFDDPSENEKFICRKRGWNILERDGRIVIRRNEASFGIIKKKINKIVRVIFLWK